jgi:hypothetical protein
VLPLQIIILYLYRLDSTLGSAFGIRGDAGAKPAFSELMGLRVLGCRRLTKSVGQAMDILHPFTSRGVVAALRTMPSES